MEFMEIGEEELRTIIKSAPTKSCENDPLPTSLLKEHLDAILTPLTKIVNTSLRNGEFSDNLKEALLQPLIKKRGMDLIFGSFRPVSNLTFLSKLIVNLLIILDLSAAFNTISFDFLTNQLQHRFGMNRTVLTWITNYLKGRVQRVVVNNTHLDLVNLIHSVPQGLVLRPLLFSLFILPLGDICRNHNILFHSYADDQQVYLSFDPSIAGNENLCIKKIETCIQDIRVWMKMNLLKLNDGKMEVIKIGTRQKLSRCNSNSSVQIGNDNIIATSSV